MALSLLADAGSAVLAVKGSLRRALDCSGRPAKPHLLGGRRPLGSGAVPIPLSIRIPGRVINTIFAASGPAASGHWSLDSNSGPATDRQADLWSPSLAAKGKVKVRDAMQITEGWNFPFVFGGGSTYITGVPSPPIRRKRSRRE